MDVGEDAVQLERALYDRFELLAHVRHELTVDVDDVTVWEWEWWVVGGESGEW